MNCKRAGIYPNEIPYALRAIFFDNLGKSLKITDGLDANENHHQMVI